MYPISIEKALPEIGKTVRSNSKEGSTGPSVNIPAFYYSEVTLDPDSDTFIDPMGWSKVRLILFYTHKKSCFHFCMNEII